MALSWAFEDESSALTVAVLKSLENVHAMAPALWPFEVANVLAAAERRGRISAEAQSSIAPPLGLLNRSCHWCGLTASALTMLPTSSWQSAKGCRWPRSMTTSGALPRPLAWSWSSRNCCPALVS